MGALVRGRQANRYRAMMELGTRAQDPIIDPQRLTALINAYEDGGIATDADGEPLFDGDGEELSMSDLARAALTQEEARALHEFHNRIIAGTEPGMDALLSVAESADELPSGYDPNASVHERLMDLIGEIIDELL